MTRLLVATLLLAAASAPSAAEIELSYAHEFLTRGYADWRTLSLEASWDPVERAKIGFAARRIERFNLCDYELAASVYLPISERWTAGLEASGSSPHEVIPAWTGALQLQYALGGGLVATGGAKWSRYINAAGASSTWIFQFGAEYYWAIHRWSWTGYLATLNSAWSFSQRLGWDLYYGERDRVGVALAVGHELENTGGPVPIETPVLSVTLGGHQGLGGDWAFVYEIGIHRQGDYYTRTGGKFGIRRQF